MIKKYHLKKNKWIKNKKPKIKSNCLSVPFEISILYLI